jgi:hypothetical protein
MHLPPVKRGIRLGAAFSTVLLLTLWPGALSHAQGPLSLSSNVTVFASGLDNPRGLTFGPDGNLYVAEGGPATNTLSTVGQCTQVPQVGPYTGGFNSRISRISPAGVRSTVADHLPSSQTTPDTGSFVSGVADVRFVNGTLYGIEAGAGCSHGLAGTNNTLFRVHADGTTTTVADLSTFVKNNPTAKETPEDFEPDGTWYSMAAVRGQLYAVEPNHGEIDAMDPTSGAVHRLVDVSAQLGHIVPTSVDYQGNVYFGNLSTFDPGSNGNAGVYKVTPSGNISQVATGLTAVTGVAIRNGTIYALEAFTGFFAPAPTVANTGMVVRLNDRGTWDIVASGLNFPTAMTFGPDGALYVSNNGFGVPVPGAGQIVRIAVPGAAAPVVTASASGTSAAFTVSFPSTAPGQGEVYFGSGPGCSGLVEVATQDLHPGTTNHTVRVTGNDLPGTVGDSGIQPGATYWYEAVTNTVSGTETDTNAGHCYSVTIPTSDSIE